MTENNDKATKSEGSSTQQWIEEERETQEGP